MSAKWDSAVRVLVRHRPDLKRMTAALVLLLGPLGPTAAADRPEERKASGCWGNQRVELRRESDE